MKADLVVAMSEDEPLIWLKAEGLSRLGAIRAGAGELYINPHNVWARRRWMRSARHEDCPHWPHGVDVDGEVPDGCECWRIDEGWSQECEPTDPGAIEVWRVEERWRLRWRVQNFIRRRLYRTYINQHRTVIWGGRVDRKATWLDRLLIGAHRGYPLFVGDRWIELGQSELRWCHSCRATTPHAVSRYTEGWCEAVGHGESKAAPMATDLRPAPQSIGKDGQG